MARPLGSRDRIRRKYKHSFARQYLADHNVEVYNGTEQVLKEIPERLYDIKLPNTKYLIGEQFIEEGEVRKITKYEELRDFGFVLVSTPISANERWETGQKVKYEIRREDETGEHINKMPRDHHVLHDSYNRAIRLLGPRAGPMGDSGWKLIERKVRTSIGSGRKAGILRLHKDADKLIKQQAMIWRGQEETPKPVYIPEVAFMITKSNEIVCFPNTDDMPSILITGMKRSGKCIVQDSKEDYIIDGFGRFVQIKDRPRHVLTVNKYLKLEKSNVNKYYDREVNEILVIKTHSGREIKLTPEHLLLTVKGWQQAQKLNVGSYLATPRRYDLKLAKKITLSQVKLLGYIIGAAILTEKKIRFDFKTEDYDVKISLQNCLANIDRSLEYKRRKIYCKNKINTLEKYLAVLGLHNKKLEEKFIPNRIMELSDEQIKLFLSSYFSVSGHIHKIRGIINFTSRSKIVAKQLQHLLLRFGIKSIIKPRRKKHKKNKSIVNLFEISIRSVEDRLRLIEILKPLPNYKSRDLIKTYDKIKNIRKSLGNKDIIPKEVWQLASPEDWHNSFKKLGYSLKRSQTDNLDFNVTRLSMKKIAEGSKNPLLLKFANSDIYWDKITKITKRTGTFKVWDIEVDHSAHNFIANDIIVHNSFCLHSLVSRFFWKPSFNYNMCVLNDSSRETGTWSTPNVDIDQINILKRLHERPLPLPCVYFHPLVKEEYEKLYMGDVGFNITIPFKEIVDNHKQYLNLKDSARYFTKIADELRECKSEEAAQALFDQFVLHYNMPVQTANKIRAEFDTLFDSKMTDISTEGQELWSTSKNPEAVYNAFTATVHSGVIPVLETEFVSNYKDILSIYFRYFAGDLFMRQKQDIDFLAQKSEIMLIVDEAHNISQKSRRTGADALLRRCVREGGPRRIGTLLATQKFGELPDVIKDNSTYLIVFKNPGEAALIANQYNMGKYVANLIKDLGKHECIAYTTDYFIVYDTDGNRRKSKLNEIFIGKTLPPYSMHKKPREGGS